MSYGYVTNISRVLLNDPPELWPLEWDYNKCLELINRMEEAGYGPSYYTLARTCRPCNPCEGVGEDLVVASDSSEDDLPF
jgi:hypothetical protein